MTRMIAYRGALWDLDQAVAPDPEHTEAHVNRRNVRLELKDHRGAVADYAIAVSRPLNNPEKPLFIVGEATLTPAGVNTPTPCGITARPSNSIRKMRKPGAAWATFIATTSDVPTRCATTAEQLTGKNHSRISATCARKRHHHLKQGLR